MAEFPPTLTDGRRWFPSDILPPPEEASSEEIAAVRSGASNPRFLYTDDLARRLTSLALVQEQLRDAASKPPPTSPQVYGSGAVAVQSAASKPREARSYKGFCVGPRQVERRLYAGHGNLPGYVAATNPVLHSTLGKPVPPRADTGSERLDETRAVLSHLPGGQQNDLQGKLVGGIQFVGCFPRDRGGTGVFFPRVAAKTNSGGRKRKGTTHTSAGQNAMLEDAGRRGGVMTNKQEERHSSHHRPTDLGLPQDWTY